LYPDVICYVGGMSIGKQKLYTYIYSYKLYSAWKKNLRQLVANDVHKDDYLCTLITTPDPSTFQAHMKAFITLWQKKEPQSTSDGMICSVCKCI